MTPFKALLQGMPHVRFRHRSDRIPVACCADRGRVDWSSNCVLRTSAAHHEISIPLPAFGTAQQPRPIDDGHPGGHSGWSGWAAHWWEADLEARLSGVFSPAAAVTLRLFRLVLYLICEPAKIIGNVWCLQGQIAQTLGRIAEERR